MELLLPEDLREQLEIVYERMQKDYSNVARALDFSCEGCPDNCCDSYFQHHTYIEWAYLWQGLRKLEKEKLEELIDKSKKYIEQCKQAEDQDERPQVMCPLNEDGFCILYHHRLLVCRTHGVPARLRRPDGKNMNFPGCFRCQEIVQERENQGKRIPSVDRTPVLTELVKLEADLLEHKRHVYPRVKKSIAEMIVEGAPTLPTPHCEKTV